MLIFLQTGEHAASRTDTEDLRKGCSHIAVVQYKMYTPAAWAALSVGRVSGFFPFSRLLNIFLYNSGRDGPVSIQFLKNMHWNAPRITLNTDSINTNEIADIHFKISNNVHCVNV